MNDFSRIANGFFRVVIRPQSYINVLYLLLSFPLGLTYFIFLVVGLSLGSGLAILWIGLLVLALVFGFWIAFLALERLLANSMLGKAQLGGTIPPITPPYPAGSSLWQRFRILAGSRTTWLGFIYLLLKFPLGIFSFSVVVSFFVTSIALIASPLIYRFAVIDLGFTVVNTLSEAFLATLIGLLLWPVSLHVCNGIAWVSGRLARVMLSAASPDQHPGAAEPAADSRVDMKAAETNTEEPAGEETAAPETAQSTEEPVES